MAHIPYPDPAQQSPEIVERLQRLGNLNVTRMMSHNEGLMQAYSRMGTQILVRGQLDPVLREVVILRVGQLCESDYEWHQHASVALAVGMPQEKLDAIAALDFSKLTEAEKIAVQVTEEIFHHKCTSAATLGKALTHFNHAQIVELTLVVGFYIMTAGYLKSLAIDIEDTPPLGASMKS